jgi:hypothetical protein
MLGVRVSPSNEERWLESKEYLVLLPQKTAVVSLAEEKGFVRVQIIATGVVHSLKPGSSQEIGGGETVTILEKAGKRERDSAGQNEKKEKEEVKKPRAADEGRDVVKLGGRLVSGVALGTLPLSVNYPSARVSREVALEIVRNAIACGVSMIDTSGSLVSPFQV